MWVIVGKLDSEKKHIIVGRKKYVVGRQACDIVIPDASVSRTQAQLSMFHQEADVVKSFITPVLYLEDVSKFGTFVNGKAVRKSGSNQVSLKDGDEVKFGGSLASVYIAKYEEFVVTTSCIEKAPKKALQKTMASLGGHVVRDWRACCQLLIMPKINVTIKVVCALNEQKYIVTPDYLEDLVNHYLDNKMEKPHPKNYLPEVVDVDVPTGVSFLPDERRATLLKDVKFYFLSAVQFNKTNLAVSTAGGQPILLEDGTEEEAEAMSQPNMVVFHVNKDVMVTLSESCQKFVRLVKTSLTNKKLRMITDPEVGWAVLTCNVDHFCNPTVDLPPGCFAAIATQSMADTTMPEGEMLSTSQLTNNDPLRLLLDAKAVTRDNHTELSEAGKRTMTPGVDSCRVSQVNETELDDKSGKPKKETLGVQNSNGVNIEQVNSKSQKLSLLSDSQRNSQLLKGQHPAPKDIKSDVKDKTSGDKKAAFNFESRDLFSTNASTNVSAFLRTDNDVSELEASSFTKGNSTKMESVKKNQSPTEDEDSRVSVFSSIKNKGKSLQEDDSNGMSDSEVGFRRKSSSLKRKAMLTCDNEDEDEEDSMPSKKHFSKSQQRRKPITFGDEEEEDSIPSTKSTYKSQPKNNSSKRKSMFDFSDSDDDQEIMPPKKTTKRSTLFDDEEDSDSTTAEKSVKKTKPMSSIQLNNSGSSNAKAMLPPKNTNNNSRSNFKVPNNSEINSDLLVEAVEIKSENSAPTVIGGWLSSNGHKGSSKSSKAADDSAHLAPQTVADSLEENAESPPTPPKDVKPDIKQECIQDSEDNLPRNMCKVQFVSLLARPIGSKLDKNKNKSTAVSANGLKNFKKFKKTEHAGAGKLPTIIGGRDLEVHTGSRHKDIEDLFRQGMEDEEIHLKSKKQADQMFNWDLEKTKKTTVKKSKR